MTAGAGLGEMTVGKGSQALVSKDEGRARRGIAPECCWLGWTDVAKSVAKCAEGHGAMRVAIGVDPGFGEQDRAQWRRAERALQKEVPKLGFVVVASAVTVFGAIVEGGCWICGQQGDWAMGRIERQDPMPDRGEALHSMGMG